MREPLKIFITVVVNGKKIVTKYYREQRYKDLGNGRSSGPLYRRGFTKRKPGEPQYQPDLSYVLEKTDTPLMYPSTE